MVASYSGLPEGKDFSQINPAEIRSGLHRRPVAELVAYVRKARALRRHFLDRNLFGEPAWDILLDLYMAELAQRRTAIGSVCVASGAPATTALRWLSALEAKGLVQRRPDMGDARRVFVELSDTAIAAMDNLFAALGAQTSDLYKSR